MVEDLVSVCWTTHHEPVEMIQKSLDSLNNQTYDKCEFILVNDCSIMPGVSEYLRFYIKTHKRFRYIELNENVGFAKAKNIGSMAANGKYFMFMDADQILSNNTIEFAIPYLQDDDVISVGWYVSEDMISFGVPFNVFNGFEIFLNVGCSLFKYDLFYEIGWFKMDRVYFHGIWNTDLNKTVYISDCEWVNDTANYCIANNKKSVYFQDSLAYTYNETKYNRVSNIIGCNKSAIFLDRDGVINELMPNYVKSVDEFHILPGVIEAIKILREKFDYIFIVTNQQCVGKGLITEDGLNEIHEYFKSILINNNTYVDQIYYCTDLEESGSNNRKPNTGMGLQAENQYLDFDFSKSYMVGDMNRDAEFGNRLGMKSVIVNRSEDITQPIIGEYKSLYDFAISLD